MNVPYVGNLTPRVRDALDARGWLPMMEDHWPAAIRIVCEFYVNLQDRKTDSFKTWLRSKPITMTSTLIRQITGTPLVRDPNYPWLLDHTPSHLQLVERFTNGCPH